MQIFALLVSAYALVKADAKSFVAVRLDEVKLCSVGAASRAGSFALERRCVAFAWVAFACFAFASKRCVGVTWGAKRWRRRSCAELQEIADVGANGGHFMQCVVQGPATAVQAGYFLPEFAVRRDELAGRHCAERWVGGRLRR